MEADSNSIAPAGTADRQEEPLRQSTIWLMAATVGVVVANIYYAQPLLGLMAKTFGLSAAEAGAVAMLSQAGTAAGMFIFVPLGDKFERRSLVTLLIIGELAALVCFAAAPNALSLAAASFAVGAFAATVHVLVPFAAHLASARQRASVVGTMVGGILFGVLLARTFSGTIGAWFGWRAVYGIAALAMLVLALLVRTQLPACPPELKISWTNLMRSTLELVRRHALLRESALLGALFFAAFSAFWTTLVFFLESPAYRLGSATAGLFGLVGAVGAAGAPWFGQLAEKHGPHATIRAGLWLGMISFVLMGLFGRHFAGLLAGVLLMDLGVQIGHVSNQTRIYGIDPSARSRLNMVYMCCYFTGGAGGSYLGALCWHHAGWPGVCGFGAGMMGVAMLVESFYGRTHRQTPGSGITGA
jgi:predicted MFS family arabinose efflux permease